ncbi:Similar to S.cerevisiae protein FMO1 (Flavin-containing monooxygenase) [Malassezia sympodialis ATCC 42132]|uniref:Similar to S.cerevisiae protein FMO1 (Flavin-containing monooxygenase) n=1 Tax=Malassezia sympodialis (strain ATCC 42132) TaxID=1230383 RepID=A0A1M8A4H8_MALS4|nr:Similar to S.cerevisiae protein FMO1 (Flavin-containing monooxygenase) [Malassezia sympodialis ATCC 42132]
MKQRVAVIGAGSAGLAIVQQLQDVAPERFEIVVFERRDQVGGLWNFEAEPGKCHVVPSAPTPHSAGSTVVSSSGYAYSEPRALHEASAMYEGLRTNIPSDLMAFRDFPFPEGTRLFPERAEVLAYLERFASHIGMERVTRFGTRVTDVRRLSVAPSRWQVTSESQDGSRTETFDHVAIACGWCTVPHIPSIPGLEHFRGTQWHSAWYRTPTIFRNQRVLVVGNFSSGTDVARELCGGAVRTFPGSEQWKKEAAQEPPATGTYVYQSYLRPDLPPPLDYDPRDPTSPDWCRRIHVLGPIDHVEADGTLVFRDGQRLSVDAIVWATGFWRSIPMLDQTLAPFDKCPLVAPPGCRTASSSAAPMPMCSNLDVHGTSSLTNLDDWQIFYEPDNSLALLGVPTHVIPFPFVHVQARVIAHVWAGLVPKLPQLDPALQPGIPEKWTSQREHSPLAAGVEPVSHLIETPSEEAYLDALVALLPGPQGSTRPPWDKDGTSRGPEGWHQLSHWRRERLRDRILLRRQSLGY